MNYDHYVNRLHAELALHRFNIHQEEVRRALKPILDEVSLGPDGTVSNDEVEVNNTEEISSCDTLSAEPESSDNISSEPSSEEESPA